MIKSATRPKVQPSSGQKSYVSQNESSHEKKRRLRRTANEIARHYICPHEKCSKSYGS